MSGPAYHNKMVQEEEHFDDGSMHGGGHPEACEERWRVQQKKRWKRRSLTARDLDPVAATLFTRDTRYLRQEAGFHKSLALELFLL